MNTRQYLATAAGLGGLAIVASLMPPPQASAQGNRPNTPVEIVNPVPLPVTGSVAINGTPTVNVAGIPALSLASNATVQVGNAGNNPVPVRDTKTRQVFHSASSSCTLPDRVLIPSCKGSQYVVPLGKRLVVTYFSAQGEGLVQGQSVIGSLTSAGLGSYTLPMAPFCSAGGRTSTAAHTEIRYEPGTIVVPSCTKSDSASSGFLEPGICFMNYTGYLEDAL